MEPNSKLKPKRKYTKRGKAFSLPPIKLVTKPEDPDRIATEIYRRAGKLK